MEKRIEDLGTGGCNHHSAIGGNNSGLTLYETSQQENGVPIMGGCEGQFPELILNSCSGSPTKAPGRAICQKR